MLEDYHIDVRFYGCDRAFTVEDLYQAFKQRLLQELKEAELEI
jgi:hypothetical protein